MPVSGGPYLAAAFFCERVLQEKDEVMSFIRVVDRWNVVGSTQPMTPTVIQATLFVLFKSGILRSSAQLIVTPISPTNDRLQPISVPVLFEGDDERGVAVALPLRFPVNEAGLYWFEVAVSVHGGEPSIFTYVPMRIAYLQTGSVSSSATQPPMLGQ